jgi:hypothetical protein
MGRKINCIVTYAIAVVKIMCVLVVALVTPWLCVYSIKHDDVSVERRPMLGIEEFTDTMLASMVPSGTCACRAGLIIDVGTYHTAGLAHIALLRAQGVCVTTLFVLDDGSMNTRPRKHRGIAVIPVKKDHYEALMHSKITNLDCIMIDVQETGFVPYDGEPLLASLKMASAAQKPVIVFDRPNVLGASIEGCGVWLGSRALVPFRHGMTIGELAKFCNRHILESPVTLHVVPMKHYQRLALDSTRMKSSSQYCMRGFTDILHEIKPFEVRVAADNKYYSIMLPVNMVASKRVWRELGMRLKRVGIETKSYECSNEKTGQAYCGLTLSVRNMSEFSLNGTLLMVLRFFSDAGVAFTYSERLRDMTGMHAIQSYIAGTVTEKEARDALEHEALLFFGKALGSFLYQPLPKIVLLQ